MLVEVFQILTKQTALCVFVKGWKICGFIQHNVRRGRLITCRARGLACGGLFRDGLGLLLTVGLRPEKAIGAVGVVSVMIGIAVSFAYLCAFARNWRALPARRNAPLEHSDQKVYGKSEAPALRQNLAFAG